MPVHDWTRVGAGIFHDFHNTSMIALKNRLNAGLMPPGYYAITEQRAGQIIPDVLTLRSGPAESPGTLPGATALADAPPKVRLTMRPAADAEYTLKQRTLVIRHASGHRVVALIEIISPGNKDRASAVREFVEKAVGALRQGCHLLVLDLHPPGTHDPYGMHGAIWESLTGDLYEMPPDGRLTLASYVAGVVPSAYVEPLSAGSMLPDMPLFLDPDYYINVPLEETYQSAYEGVPAVWREAIGRG